jgi:hypothetical protein
MPSYPLSKKARKWLWEEFLKEVEKCRHLGRKPPIRRRWHSKWH